MWNAKIAMFNLLVKLDLADSFIFETSTAEIQAINRMAKNRGAIAKFVQPIYKFLLDNKYDSATSSFIDSKHHYDYIRSLAKRELAKMLTDRFLIAYFWLSQNNSVRIGNRITTVNLEAVGKSLGNLLDAIIREVRIYEEQCGSSGLFD